MTILLEQRMPVPRQMVEEVSAQMNVRNDPPPGLLVHVVTEEADGVHIVDVWNSAEEYEAFAEARLRPALESVAAANGMEMPADGPAPTLVEAFDLVRGAS